MGLIKRNYIDQETVITAENMNAIQDAVIALEDGLFSVDNDNSGEVITITDAANRGFRIFNIFGKTTQDGTPTPENPVELVSVGDSGSITVNVTGDNKAQNMSIATPYGLLGIPVASGGNYTDANGQQWICDEIDLARGVYVQRVIQKTFDGSSDEKWTTYVYPSYEGYYCAVEDMSVGHQQSGFCDRIQVQTYSGSKLGVWLGVNNNVIYVHHALGIATTVDGWATWLSANPLTVQYALATPIETPLSEEDLAAYAALHTYKGRTTVSNDAGAYMELEYVMDAKKYLDSLVIGGGPAARLSNVTLSASKWTGSDSLYSQVVNIDGITEYSKVDLLPSVEQLAIFHTKDVSFVTENEDGVVTVYAVGVKPTNDYTMQVSITEVAV